jgi:hypothetical protein
MEKISPQTVIKRNPQMVTSNIDGEIVMMSIDNSEYYGLDDIGSRIWELMENPILVDDLIGILLSEFEVEKNECISDTLDFLNNMTDKNLVIVL